MKVFHQVFLSVVLTLSSLGQVAQGAADPGQAYFERGQFELAAEYWEGALRNPFFKNRPKYYIDTSVRLAAAYQSAGHLRKAHKILKTAFGLAENGDDPVRYARVLMQLSDVYVGMRNFQEGSVMGCMKKEKDKDITSLTPHKFLIQAKQLIEKAEETLAQKTDRVLLLANVCAKKGTILLHEAKLLSQDEELGAQKKFVYEVLPVYEKSLILLNGLINSVSTETEAKLLRVKISLNMIQGAIQLGSIDKISNILKVEGREKIFDEVSKWAKSLTNSHDKAFALIDIAQHMPEWHKKLLIEKIGKHGLTKKELSKLLSSIRTQRYDILIEAIKVAHFLKDTHSLSYAKGYLAELYAEEQRYDEAIKLTRQAIYAEKQHYVETIELIQHATNPQSYQISSKQGGFNKDYFDPFASKQVRIYLPSLLDETSEKECNNKCKDSFSVGSNLPMGCKGKCQAVSPMFLRGYNPERLFRLEWQLGKFLMSHDPQKAQENCQNAVEATAYECAYKRASEYLQQVRVGYGSFSKKVLEDAKDFYFDWANVLLQQATNLLENSRQVKLEEVINVIEQFQIAEVRNYFQDECLTELRERKQHGRNDSLLRKDVAVFYPLLFDDRIELLLSFSQGKQIKRKTTYFTEIGNINLKKLKEEIGKFQEELSINRRYDTDMAGKFYNWFIRPIEDFLIQVNTLIIVPHDVLNNMPFAALCDGTSCNGEDKKPKFLIEKVAISFAPSIELTDFGNSIQLNNNTLALLNGSQKFLPPASPLPSVPGELKGISCVVRGKQLHPNGCQVENEVDILQDENFTFENMKSKLEKNPYSILHFSTHGKFSNDMRNISLLTYRDQILINQLATIVNPPSIKLLTLSACETARKSEKELRGLGLAGILLKTGVPTVIGTLGKVDGDASAKLMESFYEHLFDGEGKTTTAQALREAQLQLLSSSQKDPYYWAQFVLLGNSL